MSSPKSATISLPLLFLTLASLTLSVAAVHNGCPRDSIPALLEYYDLPGGIFPANVKDFSCNKTDVDNRDEELWLKIELEGSCIVPEDSFKSAVKFEPEISAIISHGQLEKIHGVTFTVKAPSGTWSAELDITRVEDVDDFRIVIQNMATTMVKS